MLTFCPIGLLSLFLPHFHLWLSRMNTNRNSFDKSLLPELGHSPISLNYAGVVRDRTPDSRFFLVDIFGQTEDFETPESSVTGQRVMRLEDLLDATFFRSFENMQDQAAVNTGLFESLDIN